MDSKAATQAKAQGRHTSVYFSTNLTPCGECQQWGLEIAAEDLRDLTLDRNFAIFMTLKSTAHIYW